MSSLAVVFLVTVAGLLLAALAAFVALRSRGWRRRGATASASALALIAIGGLIWAALPNHAATNTVLAPVDAGLTLYAQGRVCGNVNLYGAGCTDEHVLYALSGTNGGLRWQHFAGSLYQTQSVLAAGPDVLYGFIGSASGEGSGTLTAWRAVNGSQLWQRQVDVFPQQMALAGDRLVLFATVYRDGMTTLIELRTSDGAELRRATLPLYGQFTVAEGTIYGCANGIEALRVSDLGEMWHYFPTPPSRDNAPPPVSGLCYFSVADGVMYAEQDPFEGFFTLSAADGHLLWRSPATTGPVFVIGAGGGLVLSLQQLDHAGTPGIVALRATDGQQVWQYPAPSQDKLPATPGSGGNSLLAGDTLYVGGSSLTALRLRDGAVLWRHTLAQHKLTAQATASGVVFALATPEGFVNPSTPQMYALALRAGDGHEYWRTVATSEHLTLVCSVP